MSELFITKLLNMSLAGGAVVLIIAALRLVLRRVPKKYSCLLWLLALVRLLWPFTIPSPISLLPVNGESLVEMAAAGGAMPWLDTGIEAIDGSVNLVFLNNLMPEPEMSAEPAQILFWILGNIWIGGLVVFTGVNLLRYGRMKRLLRQAVPGEDGAYYSDHITMPMVLGFLKPRIYLPSQFLTEGREEDKSLVLAHEKCHIKRKDPLVKLLAFAALAVHWFNPLAWLAFILLCRDLEMACDERVLEELGEEQKKGYSLALLHFAERNSGLFIPLAFGESHTESRIKNILNYKKPSFWIIAVVIALVIAAAATLLTDPPKPDAEARALIGGADSGPGAVVRETDETQERDDSSIAIIGGADGPTAIYVAGKVGEEGIPAAQPDLEAAKSQPYGMAVELDYVGIGGISMHGSFGYLAFEFHQDGNDRLRSQLKYAVSLEEAGPIQMQGDGYTEVLGSGDGAIIIPDFHNPQAGPKQLYVYNGQLNTISAPIEVSEDFWSDEGALRDAPIEDEYAAELSGLVREQFGSQMIYGPVMVPEYDMNVYGFLAADGENLEDVWYGLWWRDIARIVQIPLFEN